MARQTIIPTTVVFSEQARGSLTPHENRRIFYSCRALAISWSSPFLCSSQGRYASRFKCFFTTLVPTHIVTKKSSEVNAGLKSGPTHGALLAPTSRWLDQLALAKAVRCTGQIQACWRGFAARRRFHVLGSGHSMEEEALKGAKRFCLASPFRHMLLFPQKEVASRGRLSAHS